MSGVRTTKRGGERALASRPDPTGRGRRARGRRRDAGAGRATHGSGRAAPRGQAEDDGEEAATRDGERSHGGVCRVVVGDGGRRETPRSDVVSTQCHAPRSLLESAARIISAAARCTSCRGKFNGRSRRRPRHVSMAARAVEPSPRSAGRSWIVHVHDS